MELTQEQIEVSHLLEVTEKGKAKSTITNADCSSEHRRCTPDQAYFF